MLHDPDAHPQIDKRMRLTAEVVAERVEHVGDVVAQGATALQRFFSLAVVGDIASVRLAELAGVDPTPVPLLEDFKKRLRED
jgi:glucose/mannose-6-phosphate isomerase